MTPQQQDAAAEAIDAEYRANRLTRTQRDAALEALDNMNTPGFNWDPLLQAGVNVLITFLLGVPVAGAVATRRVMKIRGPVATPEERVKRTTAALRKSA